VFRRIVFVALVAPLLALAPSAGPGAAAPAAHAADDGAVHPEWGSTQGEKGVLRKGCKKYHYAYSITPPEGDWALEVVISGPDLEHMGGGAFMAGYDPTNGTGTYKLCFNNTHYGRFTIEAKLSVANGPGGYVEGWLPPSHFRLHRPHR
jgi:hypothetical protein